MEIELLPANAGDSNAAPQADIVWLPDQPSPFGNDEPPPYRAVLLYERDGAGGTPGAARYRAHMVTGKQGPEGAIQLHALIERREGQPLEDAFRHWDEHIPLAVEIHHKALRYRQFRFIEKLSADAPDYVGFAVLDFASPEDLRTGLYRDKADMAVLADDIADFIARSDVMYGSERR